MNSIQRWRHTHLIGPVTCEVAPDPDGGLVTYDEAVKWKDAAVAAVEQRGYVPGELRATHPEPCRSHRGPCICVEVEVAHAAGMREAMTGTGVALWRLGVKAARDAVDDDLDRYLAECDEAGIAAKDLVVVTFQRALAAIDGIERP